MKPCVIICGPTASGKTGLSLYLAQRFQGSIVSADSMQIYREMNIGTAKPTLEERAPIPHYGMDICSVYDAFSVVEYQKMAKDAIEKIVSDSRLPFLVGGTGLYIDSILYNTSFADVPEDPQLRKQLEEDFDRLGGQVLWERLHAVDPVQSAKLSIADKKRIVRALEVNALSGKTLTEFNELSRQTPSEYRFLTFVLTYRNREVLYERINRRVDLMMKDGLLEEAKFLFDRGIAETPTASQAIGYKELFGYLRGECSLEEALEVLKRRSRNYAKRQITWFKRYEAVPLFMEDEDVLEKAEQNLISFLKEEK